MAMTAVSRCTDRSHLVFLLVIVNCLQMILNIFGNGNNKPTTILAADIGASKANLAVCEWNGGGLSVQKKAGYKTKGFKDIHSMIRQFLSKENMPEKICFGVAGPVHDNKATLTNINWQVDGKEISDNFNNIPVILINDLEAAANGLAVMHQKDMYVLHEGEKDLKGNCAIISPGTGLGEAGLYQKNGVYYPFATEGGHCDFAPRTDVDLELYLFLRKQWDHVSWERLISGPGICMIYDFLHHEKEREEPAWLKEKILAHDKATVISSNAGECEICGETMEYFLRYLAHESANLVLKLKATGGLFIGGGIVPHLLPIMQKDFFLKWFSKMGRLKNLLQRVPVKIILNEEAPLLGAAYFGMQMQN